MSRFFIACGGTGGHLAPGIALAESLRVAGHEPVLLISRKSVDSRLSAKYADLRFERIPAAPLGWTPWQFARFVWSQMQGFAQGWTAVRREKPAAVIGFGGFTTASYLLAAAALGVPVVLHEANRVPGKAVRLLGRLARRIYLPPGVKLPGVAADRARPAGLPVRIEIQPRPAAEARSALGLEADLPVVAVLGGSQGAQALNAWAERSQPVLAAAGVQLYVITGPGRSEARTLAAAGPDGTPVRAMFVPFSDRMNDVIAAADLAVSRSGAGTLAELARCGTPAVLLPYPHAADDHQSANARWFVEQGGGEMLDEQSLGELLPRVLLHVADSPRLARERAALRTLDRASSTDQLVHDLTLLGRAMARRRPVHILA